MTKQIVLQEFGSMGEMTKQAGPGAPKYADLVAELERSGPALVAFSGGVDSSFLLVAARDALGSELKAVIGVSPSLQKENLLRAHRIAEAFDIELEESKTSELEDPRYLQNDENRCFFCKAHLFGLLAEIAGRAGDRVVYDGTHADDRDSERPGRRAAQQFGIRSPLAELGWTKRAIRDQSHRLGLETWDQPASPCLSSRIQRGVGVTVTALRRIESAEVWLRSRGFDTVRVRDQGGWARVEVGIEQLGRCLTESSEISEQLEGLGFDRVVIDRDGYRSGGGNSPSRATDSGPGVVRKGQN